MPARTKAPDVVLAVEAMLRRDVTRHVISANQAKEVRKELRVFQRHRRSIERTFGGRIVGYAGGNRYVADTLADLIGQVNAVNPALLFYGERVP